MRPWLLSALAVVVLGVLVGVGLSQTSGSADEGESKAASVAELQAELEGSPEPFAALHAQAGRRLDGSLEERITSLKGTPVVVNKWASWCGPCRAEFPFFQDAGVRFGKQVAFLGLNSGDNDADATSFLHRFPVPFPHFVDPKERTARALGAGTAFPVTIFYTAKGERFVHQGGYASQAQLDADIRRYALS